MPRGCAQHRDDYENQYVQRSDLQSFAHPDPDQHHDEREHEQCLNRQGKYVRECEAGERHCDEEPR